MFAPRCAKSGRRRAPPRGRSPTRRRRRKIARFWLRARILRERADDILAANAARLRRRARKGLERGVDRPAHAQSARIEAIARGLEEVAALADPVGRVLATFTRPNGLIIERVATPLGVVGVIYESRPM